MFRLQKTPTQRENRNLLGGSLYFDEGFRALALLSGHEWLTYQGVSKSVVHKPCRSGNMGPYQHNPWQIGRLDKFGVHSHSCPCKELLGKESQVVS